MAFRTTDAAVLSALDSDRIAYTYLAELDFADGLVRIWAGPKDSVLQYLGHNWVGTGDLGELREISESDDLTDDRLQAVLHAADATIDSVSLEANEGRRATFYLVLLNPDTGAIIGHLSDPREMGAAWSEPKVLKQKGQRLIVHDLVMEFVSEGTILKRRHIRRLTNEDTLEMDPNDNFNEFASDPDMSRGTSGALTTRYGPWNPNNADPNNPGTLFPLPGQEIGT